MAPRKQDVVNLPILHNQASAIPRPLLELYNRASLFLDKVSTHQDHYWAVGIHKAIHASYPECGETHTATTETPGTKKRSPSCQVSPQTSQAHRELEPQYAIDHRASKEERRSKSGPPKLKACDTSREDHSMVKDQSLQLARWWIALADVQTRIDNEIVPVGIHLGVEDPDLMIVLETLPEKIKNHFDHFKLQVVIMKA